MENVKEELRPYLIEGETLLWVGRPKRGLIFRKFEVLISSIQLIFFFGILYWFLADSRPPIVFYVLISFFGFIWIVVTVGRFFLDAYNRSRIVYGITQERILIRTGIFSKKLRSVSIKNMEEIEFIEKRNGYGTLIFGTQDSNKFIEKSFGWLPAAFVVPAFEMIPKAKEVYQKIITLQKAALI